MPAPSNPRKFACKVLQTIFRTQAFADDVFDAEIKDVVLSDQDRGLAFELVEYRVPSTMYALSYRVLVVICRADCVATAVA